MTRPHDPIERTLELLREHMAREEREPVTPFETPEQLRQRIDLSVGTEGVDDEELFAQLREIIATTPRTSTRGFFNQLFSGRDDYGSIGELIAVFLNSSMYTFKAGGPQVMIETELTAHMSRIVGYENGEGTFAPGGSLSNLSGMLLARSARRPASRNEGLGGRRLTLYTSELGHYSIPKAANILGLGREQVRKIGVDDRGRMRPDALRAAIDADLERGHEPFLVVATSGTTVLGAFDPLPEIADVSEEFGLWLHVDAALGGSMALSETHRHLLDGSERSNSFTWDAHKLMPVPLSCSAILVRERGQLFASLNETASYLFQSDEGEYDLGTMSLQCGRRNDALKLWGAWKHHGDRGFGRQIDHFFELAAYAAEVVEADDAMRLSKRPESINVCFEVEGKDSEQLCQRLREEGRSLVGFATVEGRKVIRLAVVNPALAREDIDRFFDHLRAVAVDVPSSAKANVIEA